MNVRLAAALLLALAVAGCPKSDTSPTKRTVKPTRTVTADAPTDKDKADNELLNEAMSTMDMKVRAEKLETLVARREAPEEVIFLKRQLLFTYAELGNIEKIESLASQIPIDDDLDGAEVRNAIAYTYAEKGIKLAEARALIMKALSVLDLLEAEESLPPGRNPESTRGYFLDTLGWIDHRAGKNREAAAVLEEAARRLDHATIRWHLGEAYLALGDHANAGKAFARAVVLDGGPDSEKAKESLDALGKDGKADTEALLKEAKAQRQEEVSKEKAEHQKQLLRNRLESATPEFTMTDYDGKRLDNAGLNATVTVLDFWASWCAPCKDELPIYQALYEKYKDRVRFLAVSVDNYKEEAEAFMKDEKFDFPYAYDDKQEVARQFDIQGLPTIVVIGPCGRINWVHKGFKTNIESLLTAQIDALLSERGQSCEMTPGALPTPAAPASTPAP